MKDSALTSFRLEWVDGLKGICAIIVVLQHTSHGGFSVFVMD